MTYPVCPITDRETLKLAVDDLIGQVVGFDTETTGLDPISDRLRLIQFAGNGVSNVLDTWAVPRWQDQFQRLVDGCTLVAHNILFDLAFLVQNGVRLPKCGDTLFDTMIARQLVRAGLEIEYIKDDTDDAETGYAHKRNSLAATVKDYLGISISKEQQRSDWSIPDLSDEQLTYAGLDAELVLRLYDKLQSRVKESGLSRTMGLEMRALPTLVKMKLAGMPVDVEEWKRLAEVAKGLLAVAEEKLDRLAGQVVMPAKKSGRKAEREPGVRKINWNSSQQILHVLRERGHEIENTTAATLKTLAMTDELAEAMVEYRYAQKRAGTYGEKWLGFVNPNTGRVHPKLNPIGAEQTGRMSSSTPNMQQIPNKEDDHGAYKKAFKAPAGRVLVKADYSQIELRVAAEIAPCPDMLDAFDRDQDLHTLTAETVLGHALSELPADERKAARQRGKVTNFGRLFGMGSRRFVEYAWAGFSMRLSEEESVRLGQAFFRTFPGIKRWHQRQTDGVGETRTLSGRRRQAVSKFTEKLNAPVQGTAADVLKTALAIMHETEDELSPMADMRPLICVHDEIVVECHSVYADEVRTWLEECMVTGQRVWLKRVKAKVDAAVCSNWYGGE